MSKSAPRPVTVPPTPAAKYSPLKLVFQRPAALESVRSSTSGKIRLYSSEFTKLRTLRPNPSASSPVLLICIIFFLGNCPRNHAGNK